MKVGIRELKANLSRYVEVARRGETIVVTDRGQPKAVLGPISLGEPPESISQRMDRGIREGWITPARSKKREFLSRKGFKSDWSVQELMDKDRGD